MLMCLLCSKLTIKTPKQANVFIVLKINNKDTKTSLGRQRMFIWTSIFDISNF